MKNKVDIETYRFVGDSKTNRAAYFIGRKLIDEYSQTDIIDMLNENKHLVCGGSSVKLGKNDKQLQYLINYGEDVKNPKQIIRIIVDKENLENGDINTLAVDSICQHAIRVKYKNNKKLAISAITGTLIVIGLSGAIIGGMIYAAKEEDRIQAEKAAAYQEWLQEQRMENGTYESWLEKQGLIDENSIDETIPEQTNGRSLG